MAILADQPEVVSLATLASVAPSKVAAAFNDPNNFFDHLTLDELNRLQSAAARLGAVITEMGKALAIYADVARRYVESQQKVEAS